MNHRRRLAGLAATIAIALAPGAACAAEAPVKLDRITIHLLYAASGTLSRNIAPPARFDAWNTIIGEGGSGGPADDMLVEVHVSSTEAEQTMDRPLAVVVRNAKGAVMAQRTLRSLLLERHQATAFLFLPNSTCAGRITVQATLAGKTLKTALNMACGE
jgi:hypothetical protein